MAPHSSTLAWKIPWTEEPGGLQSIGSVRVGYDWATSLSLFTFMHWKRKWQPTPVFLPWESQGWGNLPSMGSHRVRHGWSDLAVAAAAAAAWGSQGKNTEVVCHSLLQWTTFCQTSPPWPIRLGWPHMAWLSFIELDKAVFHVIRLAGCLWLWFQSICPLMPSLSAYCLTWVSFNLDVGYLFMAAPAKRSHCSLLVTTSS